MEAAVVEVEVVVAVDVEEEEEEDRIPAFLFGAFGVVSLAFASFREAAALATLESKSSCAMLSLRLVLI